MGFWDSKTGDPIDGSASASFAGNFGHVPDNTIADAVILEIGYKVVGENKFYQVVWRLTNGDYEGTQVKQAIRPFEEDVKKSQRALNMLKRLYLLTKTTPRHNNSPGDEDLAPMKGVKLNIKIGNGIIAGEERTWVREVHEAQKYEAMTGFTKATTATASQSAVETAFSRNEKLTLDEDLPF